MGARVLRPTIRRWNQLIGTLMSSDCFAPTPEEARRELVDMVGELFPEQAARADAAGRSTATDTELLDALALVVAENGPDLFGSSDQDVVRRALAEFLDAPNACDPPAPEGKISEVRADACMATVRANYDSPAIDER